MPVPSVNSLRTEHYTSTGARVVRLQNIGSKGREVAVALAAPSTSRDP